MARRTAGKVGCGGPLILSPPLRVCEAAVLKESVGDHCHEGVTVNPLPGSSFEVIEAEFFLQLLVGLLADPARLDGAGQCLDRRFDWQGREIVFALPTGTTFADQPGLIAGHVLTTHVANALSRPVGDAHTHSGEARRQAPLGAAAPGNRAPLCLRQHGFSRDRLAIRNVPLSRATSASNGKDQLYLAWIDLLVARNADSPL